ncbi:replication-relaxation family protein [Streptomyces sp. RPT161]|uniref:replication-relaxation family protein n=1 Tax=Streptomyces sp. RPT161 TaxID=3015993 RepID=UPI0022B89E83|nr:replication-relaxation family protein [Streptomyces sp. RPT161]
MPAAQSSSARSRSAYVPRAATQRRRPNHLHRARTDLATLAARLTPRDLWLTAMLHEHRVLTSHHITALAFTGHRNANRRLRDLYFLGLVDSFRPLLQTGSAPEHYTLGRTGAEVLAAIRGTDLASIGWRKDLCARTAFSPTLDHDLNVNTHLVTLATTHRQRSDQHLAQWLSPRSAKRLWGDWIRPDAYAHWHSGSTTVPFFLEYDTGTERPLARLEAKLPGYASLAATTGIRTALLIHTSTTRREAALRTRLTDTAHQAHLPVATTSADLTSAAGLAGPIWLPLGSTAGGRLPLAALAAHWPGLTPALTTQDPALSPVEQDAWPWRPVPPLPSQDTR